MARAGAAARRYAEAAFEIAERDNALDRWRDDLRIAAEMTSDPRVARVLGSPRVRVADRDVVLEQLLGSRISPGALNLVRLLTRRSKLEMVPAVAAEFSRLLNLKRGIVSAVVTSALPLTPDEDRAIRAKVAQMTGTTVDIQTREDPALIGGLTVRIGDRLIDASVRGRLERLREQLLAGTRAGG
jgi:F-type H+-transporting ATPase subunit delta